MDLDNKRTNTKSESYKESENILLSTFKKTSIPDDEILENLHLFITPQQIRRILFFYEIYQEILPIPGVIMQFGVRWGRELALFESFRTTFEPFNHSRKIIGFDTFNGYFGTSEKDGNNKVIKEGNLTTSKDYENELNKILSNREKLSPIPNIQKYKLLKGDASDTLKQYLKHNPQTVISLVHMDMNLYEPTKNCLELVKPYLTKGSIVIIDEINLDIFPGETIALNEVFGLNNIKLRRHPSVGPTWPAYFIVE